MSLLYKRRAALALIGTGTYPNDDVPDETNIILTYGMQFQPFQGNTETLDPDRDALGAGKEYYTGPYGRLTFSVDLVGSEAAGTAPPIGELLRMCAMSETIDVGVDVEYGLISDRTSMEWGSIYFNHDGEQHKLTGVRGNARFVLNAQGMPKIEFDFMGLWDQTPTAVALGALDYSAFKTPKPTNAANTVALSIDGYSANCESLTFDVGNDVQYRNNLGSELVLITDRSGSGSANVEKPALADKDFYDLVRNHTVVDLSLVHESGTAGRIITFAAKAQLKMSPDTDSQGIAVMPLDLRLIPTDAGNDELLVTFS